MSTPPRSAGRLLRFGLLGAALVLVPGCSADAADAALTVVDGGDIDVSVLAVGDCINAVDGDILAGLDAVPCTEKHDWEVYAELTIAEASVDPRGTGGTRSGGTDAIVAAAEEGCGAAFWPFLGLSTVAPSALGYTYIVPDGSAGSGPKNAAVLCLIGDMNGPVAGSLAGAAR